MKTPDEIKKGLECCMDYQSCVKYGIEECPYNDTTKCMDALLADALAYIQQLESDKQQFEGLLNHMNQLRDAAAGRALKMEERVKRLERERDAAVGDIPRACGYCKWFEINLGGNMTECHNPNGCRNISGVNTGFEWRGVKEE